MGNYTRWLAVVLFALISMAVPVSMAFAAVPTVNSIPAGNGSRAYPKVVAIDADGNANVQTIWVRYGALTSGNVACYLAYDTQGDWLYLQTDGGGWTSGQHLGSGSTLTNSYCSVVTGSAHVEKVGNKVKLFLPIVFNLANFSGTREFWIAASDLQANNSGWEQNGSWNVTSVWVLNEHFPNIYANASCALENDGTNANPTLPWFFVVEPVSTCPGAPAGSICFRRGNNADRGQAPWTWPTPYYYDHGWDYDVWSNADGKAYYYGLIVYRAASGCTNGTFTLTPNCGGIDVYRVNGPLTAGTNYLPYSVDDSNSNPLFQTIYASRPFTYTGYAANFSTVLFGPTTMVTPGGEYTKIVVNKTGVYPFPETVQIIAYSGPTSSGPWTEGEKIDLTKNLNGSDTATCGGVQAYKGVTKWTIRGSTNLFTTAPTGWQYNP